VACLWGGRFNPIIPMADHELADKLIRVFGGVSFLACSA
jgi:hypothetical protein